MCQPSIPFFFANDGCHLFGFDGCHLFSFTFSVFFPDGRGADLLRAGVADNQAVRGFKPGVPVFDEFDRLEIANVQKQFADTIKALSDNAVNTTLVIVGVAQDVDGLIEEHASIDRAMVQIRMPRMTPDELDGIMVKGTTATNMHIEDKGKDLIVLLSQGLPHYTHLLGKESAMAAIQAGRRMILEEDVQAGVRTSLEKSQQSVLNSYQKATRSPQKRSIFRQVLLACALAEVDELGYFGSTDVREPLTKIMGSFYDIAAFLPHLEKFATDDTRGHLLERTGTRHRFKFRFGNPLMQPFIIMKGMAEGLLSGDLVELLRRKAFRQGKNPETVS